MLPSSIVLLFYALATYQDRYQLMGTYSAGPLGNQAASTMQSHYPDIVLTSPCPILLLKLMLSARLGIDVMCK